MIHGVFAQERVNKRTINFSFQKPSCPLMREGSFTGNVIINTEFDWEVKPGIKKVSASRAVCLRECLLAESCP